MSAKKIYLSDEQLQKVWDWCESNKAHPLTEAYTGACSAVGLFDDVAIVEWMESSLPRGHKGRRMARVFKLRHDAFFFRDAIGDLILGVIGEGVDK